VNKPRPLRPGDHIALVSPASPFSREEFDHGLEEIRRLGYVPVYDDDVFARARRYLSGTAEVRAQAFRRHWLDDRVAALIAVRGGYGSVQILPLIGDLASRRAKLFIGYSDNTSVMSWLTCRHKIPALHGPMIDGRLARGTTAYDESSFLALLRDGEGLMLLPDGLVVLRPGETAGRLFGGTLTQLVASLGTPFAFDPPRGSILFIEDVNERPYRIDRMLTQLRLAGVLSHASGIVFGEMRECDEPGGEWTARDTINDLLHDFPGPVIFGFPSGHTTGPCWTLPLGVRVRLLTHPRPGIVVEESPVG
jgi:muramoyltetrapeptide carboxypeptidase